MKQCYFVTGTDTEVGKTFTSCVLLATAAVAGMRTLGLKPVAAGSERYEGRAVNEDAMALQRVATVKLPYEQVNPVLLAAPTSPHIAAHLENRQISTSRIEGICRGALTTPHDFSIIEGAGGWRVPISPRETMADLARRMQMPVILVVGLKLGCINHALLTAEAIERDGLKLAGWVANATTTESMAFESEYVATLTAAIPAPLLGYLPYSETAREHPEQLVNRLDISCLNL